MNIAFLCRWKLRDGLTVSTALPHLKVLAGMQHIQRILLITFEEDLDVVEFEENDSILKLEKIKWSPLLSSNYSISILNQIGDYIKGYKALKKVLKDEKISLVVAHGAPAGAMASSALKDSGIPCIVSLFEPHADYMLESGVWNKFGLKYAMQRQWEKLQKENAVGLMPVTEGYERKLLSKGVLADKMFVVPCSAEAPSFRFDIGLRIDVRRTLSWVNATIGIYVGKYGGLYFNDEAFQIYRQCFELIPDFRLIILSPLPKEEILGQLQKYNIDHDRVFISSVPHTEVPACLSAADFAFATYKPGPSKKYLSPVKIGEYWANGLPVLLTEGVGDDSDIIKKEGGGALFNLQQKGSIEQAIHQIQAIIKDPSHRQEIPKLAAKYRSPEKIREAYEYFFNQHKAQ